MAVCRVGENCFTPAKRGFFSHDLRHLSSCQRYRTSSVSGQMDMIKVFVSYRRDDSRHQAGRLFDHLVEQFGDEHVFRDVDSIPLGLDFRKILTERVAGCDVLLAVIGDEWLSIDGPSGARRLDDPSDFVRFEIEAALSRSIPVIPVLVGNSPVPKAEELPVSLRDLAYRQSCRVRPDPDFHHDVVCLVRGIAEVVTARPGVAQTSRPHWVWPSVIFGVLMLGLLAAWLAGAFKVKTPDGVVRVDNVPKDFDSSATKPSNETALVRGKTVPPITATAPRSDQERIQGRWQVVEGAGSKDPRVNLALRPFQVVWTFRGTQLVSSHLADGKEEVQHHGPFSLSLGVERRLFDYAFTRPDGVPVEFKGIYEFEGEFLRVCYWFGPRDLANSPAFRLPDSFIVGTFDRRVYLKFRRVGE